LGRRPVDQLERRRLDNVGIPMVALRVGSMSFSVQQ
jgi:hypothetical protein